MAACFGLTSSNFQVTGYSAEISYTIQYKCVYLLSFLYI